MKKLHLNIVSICLCLGLVSACHSSKKISDTMGSNQNVGMVSGNTEVEWIGTVYTAPIATDAQKSIGSQMNTQKNALVYELDMLAWTISNDTLYVVEIIEDSIGLPAIQINLNDSILFKINSYDLSVKADSVLNKVAKSLEMYPNTNATIVGYTSHTGPMKFNQTLSMQRATSVMDYLISKGISSKRITAIGKGWQDPVASNATAKGRALNRRVVIYITASKQMINDACK